MESIYKELITCFKSYDDIHRLVILSHLLKIRHVHNSGFVNSDLYPFIRSIFGGGFSSYLDSNGKLICNSYELNKLHERVNDYIKFIDNEIYPLSEPLRWIDRHDLIKYTVYRGLRLAFIPEIGKIYTHPLPSSWTTDINVANEFSDCDNENICILEQQITLLDPIILLSNVMDNKIINFLENSIDNIKSLVMPLNSLQSEVHIAPFQYSIIECNKIGINKYHIKIIPNFDNFRNISNFLFI